MRERKRWGQVKKSREKYGVRKVPKRGNSYLVDKDVRTWASVVGSCGHNDWAGQY